MAKVVRQSWPAAAMAAAAIMAVVVWHLVPLPAHRPAHGEQAQAPPANEPLDAVTYSRIVELRRRLRLTNDDLAALGCSQQSAEQVLTTLLFWLDQNRASLDLARSAERAARVQLHLAMLAVHRGPADPVAQQQVSACREVLAAAVAQHNVAIDSAADSIATHLTGEQQAVWHAARANADAPDAYQYLTNLTAQQKQQLQIALHRAREGGDWRDAEQMVLSAGQHLQLQQSQATRQQHIERVLRADANVLPLPVELRNQGE